ncbi:hypothetical protein BDV93DRAFT_521207 [Ceratobasidium sp. AG-I]|nr:hypothetical protein BDV93DRAFT_521207 [Ceratobasidium sp. AG-I]
MPTASIHHWCWCGSLCASWCSRCEDQWYCSAEHLAMDWPNHRTQCNPKTGRSSSSGSSSSMTSSPPRQSTVAPLALQVPSKPVQTTKATFHGMIFPVDSDRPRLIQVTVLGVVHESGVIDWQPVLSQLLGADPSEIASLPVSSGVGGEPLRFPLQVFFRSNFLTDGSRSNYSIDSLTHGKSRHDWRGPVVALKYSGSRLSSYTNITMSDLPPLVYFLTYLNGQH